MLGRVADDPSMNGADQPSALHPTPPPNKTPIPSAATPATQRDWIAISAVFASSTSLLTCMPFLSAVGGVCGFISYQRARAHHRPTRLAMAALIITGASLLVQLTLWQVASSWLMPAMHRRTVEAVTAACHGDWQKAVPDSSSSLLITPLPAPSMQSTTDFAAALQKSHGTLQSVSVLNESLSGSPMSPVISMALMLQFEQGSASGSAKVQWVPSHASDEQPWMPSVRLVQLEVSLADNATLSLQPDAADTAPKPLPPETGETP